MLGSELFKKLAKSIGIIGGILGVVLGFTLKLQPEYSYDAPAFNLSLMICIWLATLVIVITFIALFFHFHNQETIIENLYEIKADINKNI